MRIYLSQLKDDQRRIIIQKKSQNAKKIYKNLEQIVGKKY